MAVYLCLLDCLYSPPNQSLVSQVKSQERDDDDEEEEGEHVDGDDGDSVNGDEDS